MNLSGRAVETAAQVPKAKRHDHLPGVKGSCNAVVLPAGAGSLWVDEGACDALGLLAAGMSRVVEVRTLVFDSLTKAQQRQLREIGQRIMRAIDPNDRCLSDRLDQP